MLLRDIGSLIQRTIFCVVLEEIGRDLSQNKTVSQSTVESTVKSTVKSTETHGGDDLDEIRVMSDSYPSASEGLGTIRLNTNSQVEVETTNLPLVIVEPVPAKSSDEFQNCLSEPNTEFQLCLLDPSLYQ